MIKTFDFLQQAWRDPAVMQEIRCGLDRQENGDLYCDYLKLSFDCRTKTVTVSAVQEATVYATKTVPKRITFDAMRKLLDKDFECFLPGDITDISKGNLS